MAAITALVTDLKRGGFAALNPKAGLIDATVNFGTQNADNGDSVQIWTCKAITVVVVAGFQVVTACTASGTITIGKATGDELLAASAADAAAGTLYTGDEEKTFVQFAVDDTIDIGIGGANIVAGVVRVWGFVLNPLDMAG